MFSFLKIELDDGWHAIFLFKSNFHWKMDIQNLEKCHAQVFFSCNYKSKHHKATFENLEFSKTEIHCFNINFVSYLRKGY